MTPRLLHTPHGQDWLVPPSVLDWLPRDHLAWALLDVVDQLDLSAFRRPRKEELGGRPSYEANRMVCLLLYAYCMGERSSRRIERRCYEDVAMRVVSGNATPDHVTIARFRKEHEEAFKTLFCQVLRLCREVGLGKIGVVAIDGTKMPANAALSANASPEAIDKAIEAEVSKILAAAASADASSEEQPPIFEAPASPAPLPEALADPAVRKALLAPASKALSGRQDTQPGQDPPAPGDGDDSGASTQPSSPPPPAVAPDAEQTAGPEGPVAAAPFIPNERLLRAVADPTSRLSRLLSAKAQLLEQAGGAKQAAYEQKRARREEHIHATGKAPRGRPPKAPGPKEAPARSNVTDPDSRVMKTTTGFIQGYNGQIATSEDGLVLACLLTQDRNDVDQLHPVLEEAIANLAASGFQERIKTALADAGYCSEDNLARADLGGLELYVATEKDWKQRRPGEEADAAPAPAEASLIEQMAAKLRTDEGKAIYKKRGQTVEPIFGQHKDGRGIRRLARRGLKAGGSEWSLINTTHNLLKLWRVKTGRLPVPAQATPALVAAT